MPLVHRLAPWLTLAAVALVPTVAEAASGTVTGTLTLWNRLGGYCPNARDCTGTKYPQSEFDAPAGIARVRVYLRNSATDAIIGQAITGYDGSFTIAWTAPSTPADAHITWHGEQGENRFAIRTGDGGTWVFWTYPFDVINGGTANVGTLQWGNSASPNEIAHVYHGAWLGWWDGFWWSSRLRDTLYNVQVRFASGDCPTSCATCDDNLVRLDSGAAFSPQARVMHEIGHIASCRLSPGLWATAFYDYSCAGCSTTGWSFFEPEWFRPGFEEAFATFMGDVAFYSASAVNPATCWSGQSPCYNFLEPSPGTTACGGERVRQPFTTMQALWDVFDTRVDCPSGAPCDTVQGSYQQITDAAAAFPNGRCNGCVNEGYSCFIFETPALCWIDSKDGRSMYDYATNYQAAIGSSINAVLTGNCF